MMRARLKWPLSIRLSTTAGAVVAAYLFQVPIERQVPGEPFLLFLLVVIASTLAFGASAGFLCTVLSTILSILFFEPVGSFALWRVVDLIKIELYALVATCSVIAFAHLGNLVIAARENAEGLKRLNESKSILLRESAHSVANQFASVAALIHLRSTTISDAQARSALDEAVEQIRIMGQVHQRLRAGDRDVSLSSRAFLENLCDELKASLARGRQISIECMADDLHLSTDQAVSVGLIVNELVTNAIKHAFPNGRRGCIRVGFEVLEDNQLELCVKDNGVGFVDHPRRNGGLGQELVMGLSHELGGHLEVKTSEKGSSFHLRMPYASSAPSVGPNASTMIH
jgi:two-component system, sensor histidine kinase PdtaS